MKRLTFLSHFVVCLAVAATAWFAHVNGVFAAVWSTDQSMMTSAIGALFVGTAVWLGWQAWQADGPSMRLDGHVLKPLLRWREADAAFGHLAERVLPMLGLFGTAFGLSLQAKALSGGAAAFMPLATSLYTTAAGVLAALVVAVMTFNLEQGIRRAGR